MQRLLIPSPLCVGYHQAAVRTFQFSAPRGLLSHHFPPPQFDMRLLGHPTICLASLVSNDRQVLMEKADDKNGKFPRHRFIAERLLRCLSSTGAKLGVAHSEQHSTPRCRPLLSDGPHDRCRSTSIGAWAIRIYRASVAPNVAR